MMMMTQIDDPFDSPPPTRRGMSTGAKVGIGCAILGVLLLVLICAGLIFGGYWGVQQIIKFVEDFEQQGYTLVEGQRLNVTTPVTESTVYTGELLTIDADVTGNLAIAVQSATINGRVEGDIDFVGQELTIGPEAVVTGDVRVRFGQTVTVFGTVEGEISGMYQTLRQNQLPAAPDPGTDPPPANEVEP